MGATEIWRGANNRPAPIGAAAQRRLAPPGGPMAPFVAVSADEAETATNKFANITEGDAGGQGGAGASGFF
eukprot:COSAG02_NODE_6187_length_3744_cov_2.283402_2_plen_71_part_00